MKKIISIPCDPDEIDESSDLVIDMGNLQFDVPDDKKKLYAFIFIRNTSLGAELNFDNCSFEDKEEYLLLFLKTKVILKSHILASTWIEILAYDPSNDKVIQESILTMDEIRMFISRNKEFLDNIHQFINSLPVYAMFCYHAPDQEAMDLSEFPKNDFNGFTTTNFYQLTEFNAFTLLLQVLPDEKGPAFFTNIFENPECQYDLMIMMKNLPYVNILIAMFADPDAQTEIVQNLNNLLISEEEESKNE